MPEAVEGTSEVCVNDSVPALGRDLRGGAHELAPSVVDQVVDAAVLFYRILHQRLHLHSHTSHTHTHTVSFISEFNGDGMYET